jgi:hypothetical protein
MATVSGIVERTSDKFGKFSILVGGKWYNTKAEWAPKPAPNAGDVVSFDDGDKNYIKRLRVAGGGPSFSGSTRPSEAPRAPETVGAVPLARERAIIRQNALTNAVASLTNILPKGAKVGDEDLEAFADTVVSLAMRYENYTSGDMDIEMAKKMVEDSSMEVEG